MPSRSRRSPRTRISLSQNNQPIDRLNTPTPLYLPATNGYFDINGGSVDLDPVDEELRLTLAEQSGRSTTSRPVSARISTSIARFQRRSGGCAPGGNPAAFGQPCIVPLYRSQAGFLSRPGNKTIALFGQTDFDLVGNLSGLCSARAPNTKRSATKAMRTDMRLVPGDLPLAGITPSAGSGKSDDCVVTGKVGLNMSSATDAQTYLTWSTGYKGSGTKRSSPPTSSTRSRSTPEKAQVLGAGLQGAAVRWRAGRSIPRCSTPSTRICKCRRTAASRTSASHVSSLRTLAVRHPGHRDRADGPAAHRTVSSLVALRYLDTSVDVGWPELRAVVAGGGAGHHWQRLRSTRAIAPPLAPRRFKTSVAEFCRTLRIGAAICRRVTSSAFRARA